MAAIDDLAWKALARSIQPMRDAEAKVLYCKRMINALTLETQVLREENRVLRDRLCMPEMYEGELVN